MKKMLGALAAVMLGLMLLSPPAEARCWWNGWRWHCWHHHYVHYWHPYRYYGYYPYSYYRPYYYACFPIWPFCA